MRSRPWFVVALAASGLYCAWALSWTYVWLVSPNYDDPAYTWETKYTAASFWVGLGGFGLAVGGALALMYQLARSLAKPDLVVEYSDGSTFVEIPMSLRPSGLAFRVVNKGDDIGIWFKVVVDLSGLPARPQSYVPADWDEGQEYLHMNHEPERTLVFESKGQIGAFPESPLDLGRLQLPGMPEGGQEGHRPAVYKIPYHVYGNWGRVKHGELRLRILPSARPNKQGQ